ncbi:hypothetical protein VPH35_011469 [Triticum aestivum]
MHTPKRHDLRGPLVDGSGGGGIVLDLDLISRLPNAVLGTVLSLLPTKDGARTQTLSRRWRPLWRSSNAPLNLVASRGLSGDGSRAALVFRILSDHPGPARRFSLHLVFSPDSLGEVDGWFRSGSLTGLQDLEVTNLEKHQYYPLPQHSLTRFAPTLRVLSLGGCRFPDLATPPSFPHLKQLILYDISISANVSLHNMGFGRLCISSPTLRSIGFYAPHTQGVVTFPELVIEDAPCLERLIPIYLDSSPATIRVIRAPKLEILGFLSERISTLHLGTTVFQKMIAVSLTTKMHSMKILVLDSMGPNLGVVIDFLKCFPCLEKLYVILNRHKDVNYVWKHGPLDPVRCLELHLKKVALKNYNGDRRAFTNLAKFFILNAKVLKEMEIGFFHIGNDEWVCYQHRQLQVENRASQDARIELKDDMDLKFTDHVHTHNLSIADPFDRSLCGCSKCVR